MISKCHLLRDVESTPRDPLDLSGASLGLSLRLSGLGPRESRDSHVCSLSRLTGWIVGLSDCRKFGQLQLKAASIGVLGIQSPSFVVLTVLALTDLKLQL